MSRDNFSIPGYDAWKTRAPEDEPGYWDKEPDDEPEGRELECGCVEFSDGTVTPCDEDRCELLQDDQGAKCPNRATRIVHEPWTPASVKQRVCSDCAKSQMDMGYIDGGAINGNS